MTDPQLFDAELRRKEETLEGRLIRVVPDVSGIDKTFDYLVPPELACDVERGSIVRVRLGGRRIDGWVVDVDVETDPTLKLRPIERLASLGPPSEIVDLAGWVAERWFGPLRAVLRSASPPRRIKHWPQVQRAKPAPSGTSSELADAIGSDASSGCHTIVIGPAQSSGQLLNPYLEGKNALVIVPTVARARYLVGQLRRNGKRAWLYPDQWASGAAGGIVVGPRSAVWAPLGEVDDIVVVDEHDEGLQDTRMPTWNARDVAVERARRRGCRCLLLSPAPTLSARASSRRTCQLSRTTLRSSWPTVEVVDRRDEEPNRYGLFSPRVVDALRSASSAVAVLNRKGRATMLACVGCGELVRTENGERLMVEHDGQLVCRSTGETRPPICTHCGGTHLRRLRLGVNRAAEELAALLGEPIADLTSNRDCDLERVCIGTDAALRRVQRADVVVFLDFDQELHAPRYRVAEQAMALMVLAARVTGGRRRTKDARILVQTRSPDHRVLRAALRSSPEVLVADEEYQRRTLGYPPFGALAEVSRESAPDFVEALRVAAAGEADAPRIMGPSNDGRYLIAAQDPDKLSLLLRRATLSTKQLRVVVDPPRV